MLVRNCPKLSAVYDPGNENQIIESKSIEEYATKTTTDTAVILTSVSWFFFGFKLTSDHWLPTRHVSRN